MLRVLETIPLLSQNTNKPSSFAPHWRQNTSIKAIFRVIFFFLPIGHRVMDYSELGSVFFSYISREEFVVSKIANEVKIHVSPTLPHIIYDSFGTWCIIIPPHHVPSEYLRCAITQLIEELTKTEKLKIIKLIFQLPAEFSDIAAAVPDGWCIGVSDSGIYYEIHRKELVLWTRLGQ